jgi:hypothetical protein
MQTAAPEESHINNPPPRAIGERSTVPNAIPKTRHFIIIISLPAALDAVSDFSYLEIRPPKSGEN